MTELGMYTIFHVGIFNDGCQSIYCRPAYFEGVRAGRLEGAVCVRGLAMVR